MDYQINGERRKKKDKAKEKYEINGKFSNKHVRIVEVQLAQAYAKLQKKKKA